MYHLLWTFIRGVINVREVVRVVEYVRFISGSHLYNKIKLFIHFHSLKYPRRSAGFFHAATRADQ